MKEDHKNAPVAEPPVSPEPPDGNIKKYSPYILVAAFGVLAIVGFAGWINSANIQKNLQAQIEKDVQMVSSLEEKMNDATEKVDEKYQAQLADLTSERDTLKSQAEELQKKIDAQDTELADAKARADAANNLVTCSGYTLPKFDYNSNTAIAQSLKDFMATFRGEAFSSDWQIIWKNNLKTAIHSIGTTSYNGGRLKDVFIVYYDDFGGPAIYWVNNSCFLDRPQP